MKLPVAVLVVWAVLASSAHAAPRLDALAETLRDRQVAVDPELSWFVAPAERARLERALDASPVRVWVAFLPLMESDESGGDGSRVAEALRRRVGRAGLYIVADEDGYLDAWANRLPREGFYTYDLPFPPRGRDRTEVAEIVDRIVRVVDEVAAKPVGMTTTRTTPGRLRGYKEPFAAREATSTGDAMYASAVVFGGLGLLGGVGVRLLAGRARRREARAADSAERAPARPAVKRTKRRRRRRR